LIGDCLSAGACKIAGLGKAPLKPSHEEMLRRDGLYDICLVVKT
jgi:hypothetical protein